MLNDPDVCAEKRALKQCACDTEWVKSMVISMVIVAIPIEMILEKSLFNNLDIRNGGVDRD